MSNKTGQLIFFDRMQITYFDNTLYIFRSRQYIYKYILQQARIFKTYQIKSFRHKNSKNVRQLKNLIFL